MKKSILMIMTSIIFGLLIVGCQGGNEEERAEANEQEDYEGNEENSVEGESDTFPVTIELDGNAIEIKEKPERILPMSLDVAEIVMELVEPSRVVAIPKNAENPVMSAQAEKAKEIENHVSSAVNIDPEEILSYDTDLLLLTKVHGQEEDASNVLSEVDLPILSFNSVQTVEAFIQRVELIGKAVGETEKAVEVTNRLASDVESIQKKIPDGDTPPSVLVLSEVGTGTGPFMLGPTNISYDIIQLAGATPAIDSINLQSSTPASIEQVLQMDPDYIFLLDFTGAGEEVYEDLMGAPGWDTLTAVQNNNLKVLDVKYLMNPNVDVIEGLDIMVDWIYELEE